MRPLTLPQLEQLEDTIQRAWQNAAAEHVTADIRFLRAVGEPYITAWDRNLSGCRHSLILQDLYSAGREPRTPQAFICSMPGESDELGIDVINVHAPSGKKPFTDGQRMQLFRNLLQTDSKCNPPDCIARAKFLIGGDMNTGEFQFSQFAKKLRGKGVSQGHPRVLRPFWGKPGDM